MKKIKALLAAVMMLAALPAGQGMACHCIRCE